MPAMIRDILRFGVMAVLVAMSAGLVGAGLGWLLAVLGHLPWAIIPITAALLGGSVGGSYWIMGVARQALMRYDAQRRRRWGDSL